MFFRNWLPKVISSLLKSAASGTKKRRRSVHVSERSRLSTEDEDGEGDRSDIPVVEYVEVRFLG